MIEAELTDPNHVTVGFTGQPGARTFHLQVADDRHEVTVVLEKQQVIAITDLLGQLLTRRGARPEAAVDPDEMALRGPIVPRWRVGSIQVGLDPEHDRFMLDLEALVPDDVDDPPEVRIWLSPLQAHRLAVHGTWIVEQGRPACELCGRPMAPSGEHVCPATNGHGALSR